MAHFVKHDAPILGLCSTIGVTYCGKHDEDDIKPKLCLDAEYTSGTAGTTADGIGEYQDHEMNLNIARSSTITTKYLTRLVNGYSIPKELLKDLPNLFDKVKGLVKEKFHPDPYESACCVVTKAFFNRDGSVSVVTGAVGDCMAIAWNKTDKSMTILATARQHDFGIQFNPASITDNLISSTLQTNLHTFKNSVIIIRMTDGAWQMLPNKQSTILRDRKSKRKYLEPSVDIQAWEALLAEFDRKNNNATSDDYCNFLLEKITSNLNKTKKQLRNLLSKLNSDYIPRFEKRTNKSVSSAAFHEFLDWLKKTDNEFSTQLIEILQQQEYVIDLIKDITLIELLTSLENNIEIGDDVTLSVQDTDSIYDFFQVTL